MEEGLIPDSLFDLPIDQKALLDGATKGHFAEVFALLELGCDPDLLLAVSSDTVWYNVAILQMRRGCIDESRFHGVSSIVNNQGGTLDAGGIGSLRLSRHARLCMKMWFRG